MRGQRLPVAWPAAGGGSPGPRLRRCPRLSPRRGLSRRAQVHLPDHGRHQQRPHDGGHGRGQGVRPGRAPPPPRPSRANKHPARYGCGSACCCGAGAEGVPGTGGLSRDRGVSRGGGGGRRVHRDAGAAGACAVSPRRRPGCGRFPREVTWPLSNGAVLLPISRRVGLACDWSEAAEAFRCHWMAAGLGRGPERARRLWAGLAATPSLAAANQRVREASLNRWRERRAQSGAAAMRKRCEHRDGTGAGQGRGAAAGARGAAVAVVAPAPPGGG